jgi:hypothetical protein
MPAKKRIISLFILFAIIEPDLQAQSILLTGKVTDTTGKPVSSASIKVLNSKQGTSSDRLGIFNVLVKVNDSILVSEISFGDTTISVKDRMELNIVLQPKVRSLKQVIVSEPGREQVIANAAEEYLKESEYLSSSLEFNNLQQNFQPNMDGGIHADFKMNLQPAIKNLKELPDASGISSSGLPSLVEITRALFIADAFDDYRRVGVSIGGMNSGFLLPTPSFNADNKKNPYLLNRFVKGIIVDQNNNIIDDSTNLLNFDKENCQLVITRDKKNYLTVDKEKVVAFALKTKDSCYLFMNVPLLNKSDYFLLIGNGAKYSVYKLIKSRLVKSHDQSVGLGSSGINLNEYVDQQTYYKVDEMNRIAGQFELNRKSIRSSFTLEEKKVNEYFIEHKSDEINDYFMRDFIAYLNR